MAFVEVSILPVTHWADIVVIVAYFVLVVGIGIWSSRQSTRAGSISTYFLAGRNMNFILVGASLFASNIGSGHFVGLAGSAAATGIGIAAFELNAVFILLALGWVFVPVYIASGIYTMPEYLRRRYGGQRIRLYLSLLTLLLYISTKISADLYAGAIFIEQSLHWDLYSSVIVLLLIAALLTVTGGLNAVIWTDFVQCVIMIAGSLTLLVVVMVKIGGYRELIAQFPLTSSSASKDNQTDCNAVPSNFLHLIRGAGDSELPWPGILFGLTVSSIWYWCADQVIVQRVLASKNYSHAKASCVVAGYLKLLPLFFMVLPGMAARVIFADEVGCTDPDVCERVCGSRSGCTNIAYPKLVLELMPRGLRGLMLAVMMAALMSSLTSIFNSSSTVFTIDVYKTLRSQASEAELVIVGRIFTASLVLLSLLWIPVIEASKGSQLMNYTQSITSYLAPPIAAVYFLGLFYKRTNEKGAFAGLIVGLIVGMTRFILEFFVYPPPASCREPDLRPVLIKDIHYLHFGLLLFVICVGVSIAVSHSGKPISPHRLYRLTYATRNSTQERIDYDDEAQSMILNDGVTKGYQPRSNRFGRTMQMICCLKSTDPQPVAVSAAETQILENNMISLAEDKVMKKITTLGSLLLMMIAVFLWGYFA